VSISLYCLKTYKDPFTRNELNSYTMHCKATAHVMFSRLWLCTNKLVCKTEMHAKSRYVFSLQRGTS